MQKKIARFSLRNRFIGLPLAVISGFAGAYYCGIFGTQPHATAQQSPPIKTPSAEEAQAQAAFENKVTPLLNTYCYQCHGDGAAKGGLALDSYETVADVNNDPKKWDMVFHYLRSHQMPPSTQIQPTDAERKLLVDWVDSQLNHYYARHPDPGRVTIHRLNKAEYNNTIQDLTGLDIHPADDFPTDDSGYGFDNIADVLSLPPMLMEKYIAAADKVMDQAIVTERSASRVNHVPASLTEISFYAFGERGDGWVRLNSNGEDHSAVDMMIPQTGEYIIRVQAFGLPSSSEAGASLAVQKGIQGDGKIIASIQVGSTIVRNAELAEDEKHPQTYEARMIVPAGQQRFQVIAHKYRGGDNEDVISNKKVGREQPGTVLIKFIEIEGPVPCSAQIISPAKLPATGLGYFTAQGARVMVSQGDLSLPVQMDKPGDVILRVQADATRAGDDPAVMEFRADGKPVDRVNVFAPSKREQLPSSLAPPAAPAGRGGPAAANANSLSREGLAAVPLMYEAKFSLPPGKHQLSVAFLNPFNDPTNPDPNQTGRTLTIENVQLVDMSRPPMRPPMPQTLRELFIKHGVQENAQAVTETNAAFADLKSKPALDAARGILADFALCAWRRPAPPAELDRLMQFYLLAAENGETFEGSVKLAMKTVLISPHFLFRGVPMAAGEASATPPGAPQPGADRNPGNSSAQPPIEFTPVRISPVASPATKPDASPAADDSSPPVNYTVHPIDEFALASRLSYFLWSTTPDSELLDLARRGELRKNLPAQVKRLLASPRSSALVENFAGQWLQFRTFDAVQPAKTFTDFDGPLRAAMQKEPELFFDYVMRQDRSIIDFLDGNYTFTNERLADFYGIKGVSGDDFQKVSLEGTPRRGILTEAAILTMTSNPTRTSPVKRGKWVLENVLGSPPPPPPPNVPALDSEQHPLTGSLRQQMEQHRADPLCASCHAIMDPIGFSMENFDAIGEFRTLDSDGQTKIDSTGQLATGEKFANAAELSNILATTRREDFVNCMAEKMLTYALGRGVEYYDHAAIGQIVSSIDKNDYRFSSLIEAVVESVPFQMERGAPATAPSTR